MIKCEYCNSNVDETLGTCPHCGAPLPTVQTTEATTETTSPDNTTEADSEDNTEETVSTTGSILSGLASALLRPKNRPYIQQARPVPPPMP